jgi:hypothetical protein
MLAKIAERLICIEEDGIERMTSSHDVVATSRVSVLNATIYSKQRRVPLELCRPKSNLNGNWIFLTNGSHTEAVRVQRQACRNMYHRDREASTLVRPILGPSRCETVGVDVADTA